MSKILDLAKSFEEKSSEQAKDTEQIVATEFKKHEKRLIALLNENEKAISSAIIEQNQRIRPIILKTWMIVSIGIVTAIALAWGIFDVPKPQNQQKRRIDRSTEPSHPRVSEQGGNVKLQDCIDTKNRKRLCVLVNKDAGTWSNGSLMVPMGY